jgi:peroxiredoxin Q/BCP
VAGLVWACIAGGTVAAEELKVGSLAPEFTLEGSDGRTHSLAEHRGKRVVVLAWFPKAFTGG